MPTFGRTLLPFTENIHPESSPVPPDLLRPHSAPTPRKAHPSHQSKTRAWLTDRNLAAISIVAAAVLAVIHLLRSSIWYDEAITLLTTSGHAGLLDWSPGVSPFKPTLHFGKILFDLYSQDVHPPLYFWTLAVWRTLFGPSLEVARAFSAACIVASLILLYRIARDLRIPRPWIPVALCAASSVGTWYAYDARPYAMGTFLVLLTQFLAIRKSRWTGFCAAAAVATHYFAALAVAPIVLYYGFERWKSDRRWSLLTAASFALCCAPLLPLLRIHVAARPHQYPGFTTLPAEVWALLKGASQDALPNTWLPAWGFVVAFAAFFAFAGIWSALKQKRFTVPFLYASFLGGFFLLALVTNKSIAQMPVAYYVGMSAPWLALLIAYGVNAAPRVAPLLAAAALVGLLAAKPIVTTSNYRQMVAQMNAVCPNCPVVVGVGYAGSVPACLLSESHGKPIVLLHPDDNASEVSDRLAYRNTIFFIQTNEPPTAQVESQFLEAHQAIPKNGYFQINQDRAAIQQAFLSGLRQTYLP